MKSYVYEIVVYDVWGNKKDGHEVNAEYKTGELVELGVVDNDRDIIKKLKEKGYIGQKKRYSSYEIEGEDGYVLYVHRAKDYYPVCELRARLQD